MTPLSSAHLSGLASAQRVLLAPLSYSISEDWMEAVSAEMGTLFGASGALFQLTLPTGPRLLTNLRPGAMTEYFADYLESDVAQAMIEQLAEPFARRRRPGHPAVRPPRRRSGVQRVVPPPRDEPPG